MRRTKTRPGGRPARRGQDRRAQAHTHRTRAWHPPTRKGRCRRPHKTALMHRLSPLSNDGRYGKVDASVTGSIHTNHRSARSPRPTPEGPTRDNPMVGPERLQREAGPAALPRRGPAAGTMSPVHGRPWRAPRSHPVKRPRAGERHHGVEKADRSTGATGPDEARRTTPGHEARHRGTPPATTKAHGQLPSSNIRRVPQSRRACTTRNKPRHEDRCQATPAAVQTDVCTPGSEPSPCQLRNSRRPDGRCAPRGYPAPAGYE